MLVGFLKHSAAASKVEEIQIDHRGKVKRDIFSKDFLALLAGKYHFGGLHQRMVELLFRMTLWAIVPLLAALRPD